MYILCSLEQVAAECHGSMKLVLEFHSIIEKKQKKVSDNTLFLFCYDVVVCFP